MNKQGKLNGTFSPTFNDAIQCTEIIAGRLYFATFTNLKERNNSTDIHFFSIDNELVYRNFFSDFGPLNLGCLYKYCLLLSTKLQAPSLSNKVIIHWTSLDPRKRANAALLMASFAMLYLNANPIEMTRHLTVYRHPFLAFQDAVLGPSTRRLRMVDCLTATKKAFELKFVDFRDFSLKEYERLDHVTNGDITWILPGTLLAFQGPNGVRDRYCLNPEFYADYFVTNKVKTVIRLNQPTYDSSRFTKHGLSFHDLYFPDGSTPSIDIAVEFLKICENSEGATAVHCKAGLGRTGTLIGAYLMKHFRFTAMEAIAWLRICRPGSVIGPQQNWLEDHESFFWKMGKSYRMRNYKSDHIFGFGSGIYSLNPPLESSSSCLLPAQEEMLMMDPCRGRSKTNAVQNKKSVNKKQSKANKNSQSSCSINEVPLVEKPSRDSEILLDAFKSEMRSIPIKKRILSCHRQNKHGEVKKELQFSLENSQTPSARNLFKNSILNSPSIEPGDLYGFTQGDQLNTAKLKFQSKRAPKK